MSPARAPHRGFTLIELLIVVAIIAILAAIAVPNFMEAQVRAKVSRVKTDFRTMATALESFAVDHNGYPPDFDIGMKSLTTPVAYLTSIPKNVFHTLQNPFHLGTGSLRGFNAHPRDMWLLASDGPDRDDDTHFVMYFPFTQDACPYDGTNGSTSNGDIYRVKPDGMLYNFISDANPDFTDFTSPGDADD